MAIDGTSETMTVANDRVDYLLVEIDRVAAGRVGMPVSDLQDMMRAQVEGVRAGVVADGVRRVPIVLKGNGGGDGGSAGIDAQHSPIWSIAHHLASWCAPAMSPPLPAPKGR